MEWKVAVASIAMIGNVALGILVAVFERMDPPLPADVFPLNILVSLVRFGANLCGLTAMIVFLMWMHGVAKMARRLRPDSFSPTWAVCSWFVPVVNLVVPYRALMQIWPTRPVPAVFWVWWGTHVAATLLAAFGTFRHSPTILLVSQAFLAVAAGAIIYIMRRFTSAQREAAQTEFSGRNAM